jgi:hypothetical protein
MMVSAYELERLKSKSIKLIWPGGSCTIDTGNPFCRLPAIHDEKTGLIVVPEYWVYAINGWIAPKIYDWPGGEEDGYIMVPKTLVINFGSQIALNVSDMEFFMGEDRHRELPREQYHLLYRHCIDKGHGWDYDRKVGWGFIPYHTAVLPIDIEALGNAKLREKQSNRKESYLEEEIEGYREKFSASLMLQTQEKGAVVKKMAPGWQKEQKTQKVNKEKGEDDE